MSPDQPIVVTVPASTPGAQAGLVITPGGQRNILVKALTPMTIIVARAARVFLQTIMGAVTVSAAGTKLGLGDFTHSIKLTSSVAAAAALYCIGQNILELLNQFDQKHPHLFA
jgi:hypothetical protein